MNRQALTWKRHKTTTTEYVSTYPAGVWLIRKTPGRIAYRTGRPGWALLRAANEGDQYQLVSHHAYLDEAKQAANDCSHPTGKPGQSPVGAPMNPELSHVVHPVEPCYTEGMTDTASPATVPAVLTVDEVKSLADSWDWAHGASGNCTFTDEGSCEGCADRDAIEALCGGRPMSDGSVA